MNNRSIRLLRNRTLRTRFITLAAMLTLGGGVGCHDDTVVGPALTSSPTRTVTATLTPDPNPSITSTPTATSTPTPTSTPAPGVSLAGNWTGNFHETGRSDDYFCPGHDRDVTASIVQSGSTVHVELSSAAGCSNAGRTVLSAILTGSNLSGDLSADVGGAHSCTLVGRAHGTADVNRIHLEGAMSGACNDVNVTIDLTR